MQDYIKLTLKGMNELETLKIYGINVVAFLSSFTTLNSLLKIGLLIVSIVYTIVKTLDIIRKASKEKNNDNQRKPDNS